MCIRDSCYAVASGAYDIALGVIIGEILEATGGAEKIAYSVLRLVGKDRSPLAMGIAGGIVSIPVFCDSGFVILTPIWRAISRAVSYTHLHRNTLTHRLNKIKALTGLDPKSFVDAFKLKLALLCYRLDKRL